VAIKAGQILTYGNQFLVDRIQTGGASSLNIPEDRVQELGDPLVVGIVRDIPDLTFEMQSLDVSTDIESLILGLAPSSVSSVPGTQLDFGNAIPLDVTSPFKSALNAFNTIRGLAMPWLTLQSAAYKFGTTSNAEETFTLRGDAIYYVPGTPYYEEFTTTTGLGPFTWTNTAIEYVEQGNTQYALGVNIIPPASGGIPGVPQRLFWGTDYTDTATGITLLLPPVSGSRLRVVYGSLVSETVPQTANTPAALKPAGIRGKDLNVYVSNGAATPVYSRWDGVQSFDATWSVTLENTQEFGNYHYVLSDYNISEAKGTVVVRARDAINLWAKLAQAADVPTNQVIGPLTYNPLGMELHVNDPTTGDRIKTIWVPDAIFTLPAGQAQVAQNKDETFNWESQTGVMYVYPGERPGGAATP
jgi:hypothetical protein